MTDECWIDEDGAREFLKRLKGQYNSRVEMLVNHAQNSPDPVMRTQWGHLNMLKQVIDDMEAERAAD